MKRPLYWLGGLASALCAWFFIRAITAHWHSVVSIPWGGHVLLVSGAALLIYVSTYAVAIWAWQLCLAALGQNLRYPRAATILMASQLGKYLPGNVGHHIGRLALARNAGVDADITIASMLLETLLVVLAGATCSLPALAVLIRVGDAQISSNGWMLPAAILVCLIVTSLGIWLWKRNFSTRSYPMTTSARLLGLAWIAFCLSFVLGGSALYLLGNVLTPTPVPASLALTDVIGVYAAAWLLGFLVPGSPAGLGVREFVLLLGLAPTFGTSAATMAAALLRLVTIAGDGLVFLLAATMKMSTHRA